MEMTRHDAQAEDLYAAPRLVTSLDECLFYHTMDVPGCGVVEGYWDIRGNESQYLGGAEFEGKRVLEIGPASGQLSFFMERAGADVVSLEAAEDYAWEFYWDLQNSAPRDLGGSVADHRSMMRKLSNSYWFCHRAFSSKARVHYGSAYAVPPRLGEFDISVLGCVLQHNKNPLHIIENCARVTGETMIVVEAFRERPLSLPAAEFLPSDYSRGWHTWWGFTPAFFVNVLHSMGFTHSRVSFHTQKGFGEPAELFTVVASRNAPEAAAAREECPSGVRLSCPAERLRVDAGGLFYLPLRLTNLSGTPLSSFSEPPTFMSYHWKRQSGEVVVWDGLRTPLPRTMGGGDTENLLLTVRAPADPGAYLLDITMLKEHVTWYDDKTSGLPLRIDAVVV